MNNEEQVLPDSQKGRYLLRQLCREYYAAFDITDEEVKKIGKSRDVIAYLRWCEATLDFLGYSPVFARECINSALVSFENAKFREDTGHAKLPPVDDRLKARVS